MEDRTDIIISVVVPVYNSEDTIGACIESILCQTLTPIELILVDDGSDDHSRTLCDSYADRDRRVRVRHQPNRGRAEARQEGVAMARGEWVAFVDSDDTLPPTSLADLLQLASPDTDIVLGNGHTLPGEQRTTIPLEDFRHLAVRGEGTIGVPWGSLYRRSLLAPALFDLPRDMPMGEDYIFWLRLVFVTHRPVHVLYKNVYCKGEEHTSNSFVWTADYAQRIDNYRREVLARQHGTFDADRLHDRIANLFAVAVCSQRREWAASTFYKDILQDAQRLGLPLSLKQRIFLALPSLRLRKFIGRAIG